MAALSCAGAGSARAADSLFASPTVVIVARCQFVARDEPADVSCGDIDVSFSNVGGEVGELLEIAEKRHYDEIIVLGYRMAVSPSEADAQTLVTMLHMKKLFEDDANQVSPTRVVAEILDSALLPLARSAAADDLVVSDVLSALLIAQVSQNPSIAPVLADLFSAHGAGIHLIPATDVFPSGTRATCGELVSAGIASRVTVIGYRVAQSATPMAGVVLNPPKNAAFMIADSDSVIAICTDWE